MTDLEAGLHRALERNTAALDRVMDVLADAEPFICSETVAPPELRTRVVDALVDPFVGDDPYRGPTS